MDIKHSRVCSTTGIIGMAIHEVLLSILNLGDNWHVIDHKITGTVMTITNYQYFIVIQQLSRHSVSSYIVIHVYRKHSRAGDMVATTCLSRFDSNFVCVFADYTPCFDMNDFDVDGGRSACILNSIGCLVHTIIHDVDAGNGIDNWHGRLYDT